MAEYQSEYTGPEIDAGIAKANTATQPEDLGELATKDSVDYETEVTNKPTIPTEVTEQTVAGWGFTKNTGDYTKPVDGIPATDLTQAVQTTLEKADTLIYEFSPTEIGDSYFKMSQADIDYINTNIPDILKMTIDLGSGNVISTEFIFGQILPDTSRGITYGTTTVEGSNIYVNGFTILNSTTSSDTITLNTLDISPGQFQTRNDNNLQTTSKYVVNAINEVNQGLSGKQDTIDSSHKLSADLVDDTSTTNKFVTASDKTAWNGKSVVTGTDDGTNWTSITIDGTTKSIPSGGAPQLIATKIVDDNDDPYNPIFNFPSITELQPGHYYMVTKTDWTEGMVSGVVEFIIFDRVQGGGESDQHFATGTVVYWQDGTTPSPTGTVYDNYADCIFEISQDDNVWSLWITAGMNTFNDGAEIKLYYKPL